MFGEVILPVPLREVLHHNSHEREKTTKFHKAVYVCYRHNWDAHALVPETHYTIATRLLFCMHKHFLPRYMPWPVMAHAVTPRAHGLGAWVLSHTGKGLSSESNIPCSQSRPSYWSNICFAKLMSVMPEEHPCYQHNVCHPRGTSLAPQQHLSCQSRSLLPQ